jgi:hypothetical protein
LKGQLTGRRSDILWLEQLYCGLVHLNRTVRQLKEENGRLKELIADWSVGMLRDMLSKESQRMQRCELVGSLLRFSKLHCSKIPV